MHYLQQDTTHCAREKNEFSKTKKKKGFPIFSDDGFLKSSLLSTSCHDVAVALQQLPMA